MALSASFLSLCFLSFQGATRLGAPGRGRLHELILIDAPIPSPLGGSRPSSHPSHEGGRGGRVQNLAQSTTHTRPCLTCAAYDGGAAKGTNCFPALEARVGAHGPLLSRLRAFTNLARGFVWDGDDERITYPPRMITAQHTSRLHEMQPSQLVSRSPIGVFSVRIV